MNLAIIPPAGAPPGRIRTSRGPGVGASQRHARVRQRVAPDRRPYAHDFVWSAKSGHAIAVRPAHRRPVWTLLGVLIAGSALTLYLDPPGHLVSHWTLDRTLGVGSPQPVYRWSGYHRTGVTESLPTPRATTRPIDGFIHSRHGMRG